MTVTFYLEKLRRPLGSSGTGIVLGILYIFGWILGAISALASLLINAGFPWSVGHIMWLAISLVVTSIALGVSILGYEANTLYYADDAIILAKQRKAVRRFNVVVSVGAILAIAVLSMMLFPQFGLL